MCACVCICMHLAERGGGDRLRFKRVEDLANGLAKLLLNDRDCTLAAEAGHVILKVFEYVNVLLLYHVRSGRDHLSKQVGK